MFAPALLDGRTAIVTGGGSGIGAAVARLLARHGATVTLFDVDPAGMAAVVDGIASAGGKADAQVVDVSDAGAVDDAVAIVAGNHRAIDVLVNNAGIGTVDGLETLTAEAWQRVLAVNLTGPFHCTKAALPWLKARPGASVVMIGSLAARRASYHGGPNYTAAKSGLLGFTRHIAYELAAFGIRVNTVLPGPVLTPLVETIAGFDEREATRRLLPLRRWVRPEDIAHAVLFLASPLAAACTGAELVVDAGMDIAQPVPFDAYFARRGIAYAAADGAPQ